MIWYVLVDPDQLVVVLDDAPGRDAERDHPASSLGPLEEEGVADVPGDARVGATGEYPRSCRFGCLQQTLAQHFLQLRLELKVSLAPLDRDQQLRQLQVPFPGQKVYYVFRSCVVRNADVLEKLKTRRLCRGCNKSVSVLTFSCS